MLNGGEPFFVSLWQWLLKISHAPDTTEQLLSALARQQPIEEIGTPSERADLLELFCERDLLEADTLEEGNYRFRVPLVGEWIRKQRRLPRLVVASPPRTNWERGIKGVRAVRAEAISPSHARRALFLLIEPVGIAYWYY